MGRKNPAVIHRVVLTPVDRANPDLHDVRDLAGPGHDAGVIERRTVVRLAGVAVGVDLDDAQPGVPRSDRRRRRPDRADRDGVLAPEQNRHRSTVDHGRHDPLDDLRERFGITDVEQRRTGENPRSIGLARGLEIEQLALRARFDPRPSARCWSGRTAPGRSPPPGHPSANRSRETSAGRLHCARSWRRDSGREKGCDASDCTIRGGEGDRTRRIPVTPSVHVG